MFLYMCFSPTHNTIRTAGTAESNRLYSNSRHQCHSAWLTKKYFQKRFSPVSGDPTINRWLRCPRSKAVCVSFRLQHSFYGSPLPGRMSLPPSAVSAATLRSLLLCTGSPPFASFSTSSRPPSFLSSTKSLSLCTL